MISKGISVCLFDFHGNGHSDGEYVTFGYTEVIDLDDVMRFLREKMRAKSFFLWGRSMGAATAILHLSPKFREVIRKYLKVYAECTEIGFLPRALIRGVILDSPVNDLSQNISNYVAKKLVKVPDVIVEMAIKVLDGGIKEKTGMKIS